MNIKFDNSEIFNLLYQSSIGKIEFGSKIYGLNTDESDTDIMCIYPTTQFERSSIFINHHQFQHKKERTDYIFSSVSQFIKNCLSGDATINFEILHTQSLAENSFLSFLSENRKFFYSYQIIRAYLGFAKRDLERIDKETDEKMKNKKVVHALRSFKFAQMISEGYLEMDCSELLVYKNLDHLQRIEVKREYLNKIGDFRTQINNNIKKYKQNLTSEEQKKVDGFVSGVYSNFSMPETLKEEVYKSNEFGIIY